jgi:hypothetical protein
MLDKNHHVSEIGSIKWSLHGASVSGPSPYTYEDGGGSFLRNVSGDLPDYTSPHHRIRRNLCAAEQDLHIAAFGYQRIVLGSSVWSHPGALEASALRKGARVAIQRPVRTCRNVLYRGLPSCRYVEWGFRLLPRGNGPLAGHSDWRNLST